MTQENDSLPGSMSNLGLPTATVPSHKERTHLLNEENHKERKARKGKIEGRINVRKDGWMDGKKDGWNDEWVRFPLLAQRYQQLHPKHKGFSFQYYTPLIDHGL